MLTKAYLKDALERILWTAAQVLGGVLTAANTDAVPGGEDLETLIWTLVLALLKVGVAKLVGNPHSAALRPTRPNEPVLIEWITPTDFEVTDLSGAPLYDVQLTEVDVTDEDQYDEDEL